MKLGSFMWMLAMCAIAMASEHTTVVPEPQEEQVGAQSDQGLVREKRFFLHGYKGAKVLGAAATGFAVGAGLGAVAGGWNYGGYRRDRYYDDGPYYGRSYGYGYGYPNYYSDYYPRRTYVIEDHWY